MIQHNEKLGSYSDYSYIYYDYLTNHLEKTYEYFEKEIKKMGNLFGRDSRGPSGGILLENDKEVIAGIIYTVTPQSIVILSGFVKEQHRGNKIYKTLHQYLDTVAKHHNKKHITSLIHVNNNAMLTQIGPALGYKIVCHLVHRKVSE